MAKRKNTLYVIALWIFFGTTIKCAKIQKPKINLKLPTEKSVQIPLPFDYKALSSEEKDRVVYIPEYYYTVLKKNSKKIALVGPLYPCKLVILKNKNTGTSIIFHKHDGNSTQILCSIADEVFKKETGPRDITAYIFGLQSKKISQIYQRNGLFGIPAKQIDKIRSIKKTITNYFKLEKEQIKAQIFHDNDTKETAQKNHFYGQKFVLINKDLEKNCSCPITGNIFKLPYKEPFNKAKYLIDVGRIILKKTRKIEQVYPKYGARYESDGFFKI